MFTTRTATRTAAVLGATTALTLAGTGAAMATTHDSNVDGNTVSVTFTLDGGLVDGDTCGAVLTPTAAAAGIANSMAGGDLTDVLASLVNDDNVTVLRSGELLETPFVTLGSVGNIGLTSGTVIAEDVPANVYALVSYCAASPSEPSINPMVLVGDPIEAIMGSVEMGSSNGGLDTASALLGDGGLETASALLDAGDGEGDAAGSLNGDMLGLLSGSADDAEGDAAE